MMCRYKDLYIAANDATFSSLNNPENDKCRSLCCEWLVPQIFPFLKNGMPLKMNYFHSSLDRKKKETGKTIYECE